jgi:hypothetical protein
MAASSSVNVCAPHPPKARTSPRAIIKKLLHSHQAEIHHAQRNPKIDGDAPSNRMYVITASFFLEKKSLRYTPVDGASSLVLIRRQVSVGWFQLMIQRVLLSISRLNKYDHLYF